MFDTILFSNFDDFIMRLYTREQQWKFWKIRIFKLITAYSFFLSEISVLLTYSISMYSTAAML